MSTRLIRSHVMHLDASPQAVFPLLCPVREYEWLETWACEVSYTNSGVAELDCVFRTRFPSDGPEDTWLISRYEPPALIEFVRVNALRAMRYSIRLAAEGAEKTRAEWTQILTGLNEFGNRHVEEQTDAAFAEKMAGIEQRLNRFLATATPWPASG